MAQRSKRPQDVPRMRKTTLYLTPNQAAQLAAIHRTKGIPVAFLIRQAVDRVIAEQAPPSRARRRS